jgi:NAD(P)-dependent dehydrogenase (short-subunit alcohol dehydrogenase family)
MPDLSGKNAIVTGANSGLGRVAAEEFARAGARVVLACRDLGKAGDAVAAIQATNPSAAVEALALDLADLASVRGFAEKFLAGFGELHLLCNNAGVMALPRCETADGFEMQFGTNHLGHFALTGLLLERLLATPGARIVTMSSTAHRIGRMNFDDLHGRKSYGRWTAYGQSKLANLLFAYELQRRLAARGADTISVACHPGYAATNLQTAGFRMEGARAMERVAEFVNDLLSQSAEMGALPMLYAATSPDVRGGDYIGPRDFFETWGPPAKAQSSARSHDAEAAVHLWEASEELTGVRFTALEA